MSRFAKKNNFVIYRRYRSGHLAGEIHSVVDAPAPFKFGDLRIRAERSSANCFAIDDARRNNAFRSNSLLDPLDEWRELVECAAANASVAVEHAGYHEEAKKTGRRRSHSSEYAFVIINAHLRVQRLIGPPEVHQQFSASLAETREVGVGRIEHAVNPFEARRVFLEIKTGQTVLRILLCKSHIAEEALGEIHGYRRLALLVDDPVFPTAAAVGARDFSAYRPARENALTLAHYVAVDLLQRADLRSIEAVRILSAFCAFREISRRTEIAASWIIDQTIFQTVLVVAQCIDAVGKQFQPGKGNRCGSERLRHFRIADHGAAEV